MIFAYFFATGVVMRVTSSRCPALRHRPYAAHLRTNNTAAETGLFGITHYSWDNAGLRQDFGFGFDAGVA